MEGILPLVVLKDIFTNYLCVEDIIAVYNTCTYWRAIINNFKIWKKHWYRLLIKADKTCLKQHVCPILNQLNPDKIDVQYSCTQLFHILKKNINSCLCYKNKIIDAIVLKTHHSHYLLTYYDIEEQNIDDLSINYRPILNPCNPNDNTEYTNFRTPEEIIKNNDRLHIHKAEENHLSHLNLIKKFFYIYPMALANFIESDFIKHVFEVYHIQEVILIPRILMLCENLNVSDSLVIYSTSRTTEIAVVLNGAVDERRWCELPIGGWNVTKNLYNAIQWIYPNIVQNISELEDGKFKNLCWIKPIVNMSDHFDVHSQINDSFVTLKKEQYLAAELMYAELDLCSVIERLLHGLSDSDMKNCLSHVFLTGGNCKLKHLNTRIRLDLMKKFPKYQNVISTSVHCAQALIYELSNNIYSDISSIKSERKFHSGKICKITMQDYILQT